MEGGGSPMFFPVGVGDADFRALVLTAIGLDL